MNKIISLATLSCCICLFSFGTANATKPGFEVNPNGFPSGEHYNLNIHGKKEGFTCPAQEYDEFEKPIYGVSLFIPENGTDIQIMMESGSVKGKKAALITDLQVTDPCSNAFDGDPAVVQIPPNANGYRVYARALAKPTDNPDMTVTPELKAAEDEYGNDLVYLGLVTENGWETEFGTFTRSKGKSKAIDITGLFNWSGEVCYFNDSYCLDGTTCIPLEKCCADIDSDLVYDKCTDPTIVDGVSVCGEGYDFFTLSCATYEEPTWVFNIADFVTYMWGTENTGLKLLQVRFYPN